MYSVSITTFNRNRMDRNNYFDISWKGYILAGLLTCDLISSVDIFVGHEKDEWCEIVMPKDIPVHYLEKQSTHTDNIMNVFKHVVKDTHTRYHLYLEDDLLPLSNNAFETIWDFQMQQVPNAESFSVFMDLKPNDAALYYQKGYRQEGLNTFTAVMMFKDRIRDFLTKYPDKFPPTKAPDWFFGNAVMQPTFARVPGLFKHIGLQSAAHKRCFDKEWGI